MRIVTITFQAISACGLAGLALGADASSGGELKIRVEAGRPIVSGVLVEGHGPFTFLLDTGSQVNFIAEDLASKLGWKAHFRMEVASTTGVVERLGYTASSVRLGAARVEAQVFLMAPLREVQSISQEIQGVLGQTFLGQLDYLLDLRRRRLIFGEADPPGIRVPFGLSHGRMVAATSKGRLIIDSGANALVLNQEKGSILDGFGRLATSAGATSVRTGTVSLRIGEQHYHGVTTAVLPRAKRNESDPDGLLPASLFSSLYVSNSGGYVVIGAGD